MVRDSRLIGELMPPEREFVQSGTECWVTAFAPDNSYFAWSAGEGIVHLIAWNTRKNKPYSRSVLGSMTSSDDELEGAGDERPMESAIHCKGLVWSMAFGQFLGDGPAERSTILGASEPLVFDDSDVGGGIMSPRKRRLSRSRTVNSYLHLDTCQELLLATGLHNGRIKIWLVPSGKLVMELLDHTDVVRDLKFAPDGSLFLISASRDATLKLWDMADDGNMCKTLREHGPQEWIFCCAFSPDCLYVASGGSNKSLMVWDTVTWTVAKRLTGHHHSVVAVDFSPDGALLCSASYDTTSIIWDYITGERMAVLWHLLPPPRPIFAAGANDHYVRSLCCSRDGQHVATLCDDGRLRVWNYLHSSHPVFNEQLHDANHCTYSYDGRCIAVGTRSGKVKLYNAPIRLCSLAHLCRVSIRLMVPRNAVSFLPLPDRLKGYLKYDDLQAIHEKSLAIK